MFITDDFFRRWLPSLIVGLGTLTAAEARAGVIFHGHSDRERLDATAQFDIVNGNLQVTLTNNIPSNGISSALDTVAFDISGVTGFKVGQGTASSVRVAPGSTLFANGLAQ